MGSPDSKIDLELWSLLTGVVHGLFKEPIIGPLKSKMADIRHLENRHDIIFFLPRVGDPIWIKFRRLVHNKKKMKKDKEKIKTQNKNI